MRSFLRSLSRHSAALLVIFCAASCCGCGAIGLYSLGHSLLAHNHVFKPVLPDDPADAEPPVPDSPRGPLANNSPEADSSDGFGLPMEMRPDGVPSCGTIQDRPNGETIGEKPCLE